MEEENDPRLSTWTAMGRVASEYSKLEMRLGILFARLMNGDDTLSIAIFMRTPSVSGRLQLIETVFALSVVAKTPDSDQLRRELWAAIRSVAKRRNQVAHAIAAIRFAKDRSIGATTYRDGQITGHLSVEEVHAIADEIEKVSALIGQFTKLVAEIHGHPSASN